MHIYLWLSLSVLFVHYVLLSVGHYRGEFSQHSELFLLFLSLFLQLSGTRHWKMTLRIWKPTQNNHRIQILNDLWTYLIYTLYINSHRQISCQSTWMYMDKISVVNMPLALRCRFRVPCSANARLQCRHLNGRSPVCILWWRSSDPFSRNLLRQNGQTYGKMLVWVRKWTFMAFWK